ncbi:MAG: hypothetical protein ACAH07_09660 [Methylophilaceae bacterium]|nr:hypothetical protein [Methyloradius sp.]
MTNTNIEAQVEENRRPNIAYVDEVQDERDNFFNDAYDSGLFGEIYPLSPKADLAEFIVDLLELDIDALVSDFNLSEAGPLNYNGEQLVATFLSVRSEFPCFIRTSYDEAAFASSEDVNRVYSKNTKDDENAGRYLFRRIVLQINHHRRRVSQWQDELASLLDIDVVARNGAIVERILELDSKIESSFAKDQALPSHVKQSLLQTENHLIAETERLILDMKQLLGE